MIDSYSGFFDNNHQSSTGLEDYLRSKNIKRVFLCGLATDYCVKFTALDALRLGFDTVLVEDGCRGVNLSSGDVEESKQKMKSLGVRFIHSNALL